MGRDSTCILSITLRIFTISKLVPSKLARKYSLNAPPPRLSEFYRQTDDAFQSRHGIKLVSHLFSVCTFRHFSDFQWDHSHSLLFNYDIQFGTVWMA